MAHVTAMAATRWEQWSEWRQQCALARCGQETRLSLSRFAAIRFRSFVARYLTRTNLSQASDLQLGDNDAWHLFESHSAAASTRDGKRYKTWLLARCTGDDEQRRAAVEAGATLLIRSVTREFLRREVAPRMTQSMDAPLTDDLGAPLTLADLIPADDSDPAAEAHRRECERRASGYADELFGALSAQTRVAIASKALGLSMAHARVEKAAGCRKTTLYTAYQIFEKNVVELFGKTYHDVDDNTRTIALMTLRETFDRAVTWARSEKKCAGLFRY